MSLNHSDKNYIKKNIKHQSVDEISQNLNLPKTEILGYLEKKWGKVKLNNFLNKYKSIEAELKKDTSNPESWLKNHWISLLFLSLLVILTYFYFLNNAFVSDDIAEIAQKSEIVDFSRILQFPTGAIRHIIYFFSVHIGGFNPWIFRLTNFIFHLFSTYIVYFILLIVYRSKKVAVFASALFAIHPAIAEAVLWISGGMYAQYTFFFLLAFYSYIKSEKVKSYWIAVISYLFALMSHPIMPIPLFLVFPLYDFCFRHKIYWKKFIPFFALALIYAGLALSAVPARELGLQTIHYQEKGVDNIFLILPIAISSYAELLFFPKILTLYHSELAFGAISFMLRAILTLAFFITIPIAFFKKKMSVFFWLSFFLISLSPTLTPFRLNWIVAERYIYLPSIGIFVLFGLGLAKLMQIKKKFAPIILTIFILIILALSIRTFFRGVDWENEDNLWIATGKTSPSSPNTHNNLGDVYGRHGDKEGALREFSRAIELKPNYADAYHNLGNTYREMGNMEKAMENYQMAAKINPNLWQSFQNIAALYFQAQKYDLALENIQKAIQVNPKNTNLYLNLGIVYLTSGDKEKAKQIFTQILSSDPNNQAAAAGLTEANK